jgi:hypothetical protein
VFDIDILEIDMLLLIQLLLIINNNDIEIQITTAGNVNFLRDANELLQEPLDDLSPVVTSSSSKQSSYQNAA